LQRYNNKIIDYGNKNSSYATGSLFDDGFMSSEEAKVIQAEVYRNYKEQGIEPDMIAHYSARYVLNETDAMINAIGNDIGSWMSPIDRTFSNLGLGLFYKPSSELIFESQIYGRLLNLEMILLTTNMSIYHGPDNFKWQSGMGYELVFRNGKVETDPRYIGTYNWGRVIIDHTILDVNPYNRWGNSPDDMNNLNNILNKHFGRVYNK
jgi:hypothetical protein